MASAITALVTEKRATGYKYDAEERVLARFAAFSASQFPGLEAPTRASVEAWITSARQRGVRPATLQGLAAPVRELARWLGRRGVPAYVLPAGALPRPARYVPHIYTDRELAALFAQTDRCHYNSQVPFRHLVMPVLFRTIYACGLRASEARLLRFGDVDARRRGPDNPRRQGRQRPAGAGQRAAARQARGYRAHVAGRPAGTGLPGAAGRPLTIGNIDKNFRRFCGRPAFPTAAGATAPGPRSAAPMAVNNLRSWFAGGEDAGACCRSCRPTWDIPRSRHRLLPEADRRVLPAHHRGLQHAVGDIVRPSPQGHAMATDFAVFLRRFLTSHLAGLRGCSPNTITSYRTPSSC